VVVEDRHRNAAAVAGVTVVTANAVDIGHRHSPLRGVPSPPDEFVVPQGSGGLHPRPNFFHRLRTQASKFFTSWGVVVRHPPTRG
jgi:hypothetical protein